MRVGVPQGDAGEVRILVGQLHFNKNAVRKTRLRKNDLIVILPVPIQGPPFRNLRNLTTRHNKFVKALAEILRR